MADGGSVPWSRVIRMWLVAGLLSFPVTVGIVVLSGYHWNPYIVQLLFLGACNLIILATQPVWWVLENPAGKLSRYLGAP